MTAVSSASKRKPRTPRKPDRRHRTALARGSSQGWTTHVRAIAESLRGLGWDRAAEDLENCGTVCAVASCDSCGESRAAVRITTSCDVRVCPLCARRSARERREAMARACSRVAETVEAQRPAIRDELVIAREVARETAERWERLAGEAHGRNDRARGASQSGARARRSIARSERLAAQAREREALAKMRIARVDTKRWGWRLVTVSPQWDPASSDALSVAGLRARVADVLARWRAIWAAGLDAGGLSAAIVTVELAPLGHVHVHALVYSPHMRKQWLAARAGCFVDVRAVAIDPRDVREVGPAAAYAHALREAVKYCAKTISPLSHGWIAGEARPVAHPELLARWVVATSGVQLTRVLGMARDAYAAAQRAPAVPQPGGVPSVPCRCCGVEIGPRAWRAERTRDVARALGADWGEALRIDRREYQRPS